MTSLGPQSVWDYTKESFNFLKLIFSAAQKGQQPTYSFHDNQKFTVQIGDTHHHYHGPVYGSSLFQVGKPKLSFPPMR